MFIPRKVFLIINFFILKSTEIFKKKYRMEQQQSHARPQEAGSGQAPMPVPQKQYVINNVNQLFPLNQNLSNFRAVFSVISSTAEPFYGIVVDQGLLDSLDAGKQLEFKVAEQGVFTGEIIQDNNSNTNWYLVLKSPQPNSVTVNIQTVPIPANPQQQQQQLLQQQQQHHLSASQQAATMIPGGGNAEGKGDASEHKPDAIDAFLGKFKFLEKIPGKSLKIKVGGLVVVVVAVAGYFYITKIKSKRILGKGDHFSTLKDKLLSFVRPGKKSSSIEGIEPAGEKNGKNEFSQEAFDTLINDIDKSDASNGHSPSSPEFKVMKQKSRRKGSSSTVDSDSDALESPLPRRHSLRRRSSSHRDPHEHSEASSPESKTPQSKTPHSPPKKVSYASPVVAAEKSEKVDRRSRDHSTSPPNVDLRRREEDETSSSHRDRESRSPEQEPLIKLSSNTKKLLDDSDILARLAKLPQIPRVST